MKHSGENGGKYCMVGLAVSVLLLLTANIWTGSVDIPAESVWKAVTGGEGVKESWHYIVWESRIPQAFTALACGMALAVSGLMLQTVFGNPLAGPSILGIDASARITLEQCYDSARANYPVIRQFDLLERTEQFTLENIKRAFLPQLNLSARASWQSDVTKLPFEMPGMNIEWMEQDQYQFVLELKQLVYDGGMVRARREWQKARTAADRQQAEVELYALHQRIDQVYFGILLQNAQHKQMQLLQEQLQKSLEQVQAFLKRGVVCPADVDAVQVELRTVEQSVRSLETSRKAYCEVLSLLTGMDSLRAEALVTPAEPEKP